MINFKEQTFSLQEKLNYIQINLVAPKGQHNSFGNYRYRSCEDVLEALKPLLKETGTTVCLSDEIILVGDRYYIKATASLNDGKERIFSCAYAREAQAKKGMDESQITGASSSYARKYALNGLFCIDDTKDADSTNNHVDTISDKQLHILRDQLISLEANEDGFCKYLKVDALEDLKASDFNKAITALEAKKQQKAVA